MVSVAMNIAINQKHFVCVIIQNVFKSLLCGQQKNGHINFFVLSHCLYENECDKGIDRTCLDKAVAHF